MKQEQQAECLPDSLWAEAQIELRDQIRDWVEAGIWRQSGVPWRGIHDEADWAACFTDYYALTGDESVKRFLLELRDRFLNWAKENEYDGNSIHIKPYRRSNCEPAILKNMHHGFSADGSDYTSHTGEHYTNFCSALFEMDPSDEIARGIIEDVAHHIGNWVEGIPEWYDWDRHMFRSHWLGTAHTRDYPPYDFSGTKETRIAYLTLVAYRATGEKRYLDWAKDYAGGWVERIMQSEGPVRAGGRISDPSTSTKELRLKAFGDAKYYKPASTRPQRTASAVEHLGFILSVYALAKEPRYLEAVRRAIEKIEAEDGSFDAAIETMKQYQAVSGDTRYQDKIADH